MNSYYNMQICINDDHFGNENYQCKVSVDGKEVDAKNIKKTDAWCLDLDCTPNSIIKIKFENIVFREKKAWLFFLFYWFLALLSGGEQNPFGNPFDAVICIKANGQRNIRLKTNSIKKKEAFSVTTKCEVLENYFYAPKGYKKKWFFGSAVPIALLILALLLLSILMGWNEQYILLKTVFILIFSICEVIWGIYVIHILKK